MSTTGCPPSGICSCQRANRGSGVIMLPTLRLARFAAVSVILELRPVNHLISMLAASRGTDSLGLPFYPSSIFVRKRAIVCDTSGRTRR